MSCLQPNSTLFTVSSFSQAVSKGIPRSYCRPPRRAYLALPETHTVRSMWCTVKPGSSQIRTRNWERRWSACSMTIDCGNPCLPQLPFTLPNSIWTIRRGNGSMYFGKSRATVHLSSCRHEQMQPTRPAAVACTVELKWTGWWQSADKRSATLVPPHSNQISARACVQSVPCLGVTTDYSSIFPAQRSFHRVC